MASRYDRRFLTSQVCQRATLHIPNRLLALPSLRRCDGEPPFRETIQLTKMHLLTQAAPAPSAATSTPTDWTQEQQKALEAALKKYPASMGVQRWDSIANSVPGKTKKDCVERYKYIVSQLRGKGGGK